MNTFEIAPFYFDISQSEIDYLKQCYEQILKSGQLILGPFTERFENEFAHYINCKYAVSVNTGTSALEILCRIYNVKGKKVAVPTNTNFASVAAIIYSGGIPVYMDMDPETFCSSLEILKKTHEKFDITGVVWVHIAGIISPDFPEVAQFCKKNRLFLIEDAAHAHGSQYQGIKAGNFGNAGAFSFFPTKLMTTLEGGMITTDDAEVAELAKSYRNQGKRGLNFGGLHTDLGNSWRMSEVSASIGSIQLTRLEEFINKRQAVVDALIPMLQELKISYCDTSHMDRASQYKFIIRLPDQATATEIKNKLKQRGVIVGGGVYEIPCHQQPVFQNIQTFNHDLPNAEKYCKSHICPPVTSGLTPKNIDQLKTAIYEVFK